jgi:hypothetical protein
MLSRIKIIVIVIVIQCGAGVGMLPLLLAVTTWLPSVVVAREYYGTFIGKFQNRQGKKFIAKYRYYTSTGQKY